MLSCCYLSNAYAILKSFIDVPKLSADDKLTAAVFVNRVPSSRKERNFSIMGKNMTSGPHTMWPTEFIHTAWIVLPFYHLRFVNKIKLSVAVQSVVYWHVYCKQIVAFFINYFFHKMVLQWRCFSSTINGRVLRYTVGNVGDLQLCILLCTVLPMDKRG